MGTGHLRKPRPVIVVQDDARSDFDSVVVCLLTTDVHSEGISTRVRISPTIAATGRVPEPVDAKRDVDVVMRRFDRLRAQTPRSDYLEGLTAEGVKDELSRR